MNEHDVKCCDGTLFVSGYDTVHQQHLYWEESNDIVPLCTIASVKISSGKVKSTHWLTIKILTFAIVTPLYNLPKKSLQQFSFWHLNYSIYQQIIPYFG